MTHLPIERIEVPIGLIAQLSYYQESTNKHVFFLIISFAKIL